jgi:integrase
MKFACWQKLERKDWKTKTLWAQATNIKLIGDWLNTTNLRSSLLERDLPTLETSFRSYLVNSGFWKGRTQTKLNGRQEPRKYSWSGELNTLRQIYKVIQDFYDDRNEYDKEIWDARRLGVRVNPSKSSYTLNFSKIQQPWLLQAVKPFIRYSLSMFSLGECQSRISVLNNFSAFLSQKYPTLNPAKIDRPLMVEYLSYLTEAGLGAAAKYRHIGNLRAFLELCTREGWAPIPDKRFFYDEDFPRLEKRQPRFIPEEVITQLNENLDALPDNIKRMVLILQEVGMRISELCRMPFNCLTQDAQGDFFLRYHQYKMKKDHSVPISREVAAVIEEQQRIVRDKYGDFSFLFPSSQQWQKGQPIKQLTFSRALNKLAYEKNICDRSGSLWRFQSHQFRHTVGTRMINLGVPQHIIQRYLGHETPEMTSTYAHIHDQTLKDEFAKFKDKIVDVTGKAVSREDVVAQMIEGLDFNSLDDQWMKKNILAQALPNGLCSLPIVQGVCPYGANKCLSCTHFKTDTRYLDKHKDHLERTSKIVEWAQENPESRRSIEILKENLPVKENLERIITSLENSQDEA